MKRIITLTIILFSSLIAVAQSTDEVYNPLDFWVGKWILKTTEIDPLPDDDDWRSEIGFNEFISIMDGNGLQRTVTSGGQRNETIFFWDEITNKVYTISIDNEGYVWEATASIKDKYQKNIIFVGSAKNSTSLSRQSILEIVNDNEVRFTETIMESGKKTSEFKGVWYRMPID